jgi:hypothetical protein
LLVEPDNEASVKEITNWILQHQTTLNQRTMHVLRSLGWKDDHFDEKKIVPTIYPNFAFLLDSRLRIAEMPAFWLTPDGKEKFPMKVPKASAEAYASQLHEKYGKLCETLYEHLYGSNIDEKKNDFPVMIRYANDEAFTRDAKLHDLHADSYIYGTVSVSSCNWSWIESNFLSAGSLSRQEVLNLVSRDDVIRLRHQRVVVPC